MQKLIKKYRKAKGFTLVELLIVIIIIGILAGMMMLSTGSATDKAEATKIVSNMRNIKSACLMYYADQGSWPSASISTASLDKYLDTKIDTAIYSIVEGAKSGDLCVQANAPATGVQDKLATMAKESGLYKDKSAVDIVTTAQTPVYMIIKKQ